MAQSESLEINRLIGEFTDLHEAWQRDTDGFDWSTLEALMQRGAQAYNDDGGASFHALALDGMRHSEFHERCLSALLQAGFDPFRLSPGSADAAPTALRRSAIDHAALAEAAEINPSSARMRNQLMEVARERFEPLARDAEASQDVAASPMYAALLACVESVPPELLLRISPELARDDGASGDPDIRAEGYLSAAEAQVENRAPPQG